MNQLIDETITECAHCRALIIQIPDKHLCSACELEDYLECEMNYLEGVA